MSDGKVTIKYSEDTGLAEILEGDGFIKKPCSKCLSVISEDLFPEKGMICRKCKYIIRKTWREKNKQKIADYQKEYSKKYRENNKQRLAKSKKDYAMKNHEKIASYQKEYRKNNRQKMSLQKKNWAKANHLSIKKSISKYRLSRSEEIRARAKHYRENNRDRGKLYGKNRVLKAPDSYIKALLKSQYETSEFPPEIIELKRTIVLSKRMLKEHNNE